MPTRHREPTPEEIRQATPEPPAAPEYVPLPPGHCQCVTFGPGGEKIVRIVNYMIGPVHQPDATVEYDDAGDAFPDYDASDASERSE